MMVDVGCLQKVVIHVIFQLVFLQHLLPNHTVTTTALTISQPTEGGIGKGSGIFLRTPRASQQLQSSLHALPKPIDPSGWPDRFPAKEHCSKCGLCETTFVSKVSEACAFLDCGMKRMDDEEINVHGRRRDLSSMVWSSSSPSSTSTSSIAEEARFGVLHEPMRLVQGVNIQNAQWTGAVTAIAVSMLESGMVDAVVCIANKTESDHDDRNADNDKPVSWSVPEPIIAKTTEEVLKGRGVKPALAPSLRVLDDIKSDKSIRKLLFCGVGCAVQAFRAVQDDLNLEQVYVLGTNCVDNSPTPEAAEKFIREGVKLPNENIRGYEFMQDFKVHVKTDTSYITKPYFSLPGTIAKSAIATSCLACFDYTNALADIVVGYMAAPLDGFNTRMDRSFQTLTIRNDRGARMVQTALNAKRLRIGDIATGEGSHEKIASATVASDSIVLEMTGGNVKENGLPQWFGEIMAFGMRNAGPKGVSFARYSIDYHILRNYLHVVHEWGEERARLSLPQYALDMVDYYLDNDKTIQNLRDKLPANSNNNK